MQPSSWQEVLYLRTISTGVHTHTRTLAREHTHTHTLTPNEGACNMCSSKGKVDFGFRFEG